MLSTHPIKNHLNGLYAITPNNMSSDEIIAKTSAAAKAGLKVLQFRNKQLAAHEKHALGQKLKNICRSQRVIFIVNDSIELAHNLNADGIHLGQGDALISEARDTLGDSAIIGVTCHNNLELARQAELDGANYVAFGRLYPSITKPDAPHCALSVLSDAKRILKIPICAIGGITPKTITQVKSHGANLFAMIHALYYSQDIAQTIKQLNRCITN